MNLHFQDLIPSTFSGNSRVWIYQGNRPFTLEETIRIEELLHDFSHSWLSHGARVKGFACVLFGQFIILMADETSTGVSGCSTDSSVRLVKSIEQDYNIQLFERTTLAFIYQQRIHLLPLSKLNDAMEEGVITGDSLYFNNNIQTLDELLNKWIIPVKDSWLAARIHAVLPFDGSTLSI